MNKKKFIPCATIILSLLIILVPLVSLLAADDDMRGKLKIFAEGGAGYSEKTTETTFASILGMIVQALLGFLGILFVILIIYGGFLWMTAGGEEEQIKKAKKLITNSVIGLAIVLGAFILTYFIYQAIGGATLFTTPPPSEAPLP